MDDGKVIIKNLKLEYISTKKDKYDNEYAYFKIKEKNIENKFTALNVDNENESKYILPYFKTTKGKQETYLLKVKKKYMKLNDLNKEMIYIVDAEFTYFEMNDMEGYYVSKLA